MPEDAGQIVATPGLAQREGFPTRQATRRTVERTSAPNWCRTEIGMHRVPKRSGRHRRGLRTGSSRGAWPGRSSPAGHQECLAGDGLLHDAPDRLASHLRHL